MASTIRALLIEDNPGDAYLLQAMVDEDESNAMVLDWVDTLEQGIDRALNEDFDVVLLDLDLPDSRGVDSVSTTHILDSGLPIVVVTGRKDGETAFEAIRRGAQDYLLKGKFDYPQLLRVIRFAIERKILQDRLDAERENSRAPRRRREVQVRSLLCPDGKMQGKIMSQYLAGLMRRHQVLYVTLGMSAAALQERFQSNSVDVESIQFLDASRVAVEAPNVRIMEHPPAAEAMGLRIEKLCSLLGPDTHVIIDSLNDMLDQDSIDTVAVFTHFMANRLRLLEIPGDFVANQSKEWDLFADRFSNFLDDEVDVGALIAQDES